MNTLKLSDELQIIKKAAFKGCNSLKTVTIPASVEFIYQEAFANCNGLENVIALPTAPPFLYDNSFSNYSVPLKVPKGNKDTYRTAQGWKNFINIRDADKYKLTYVVDGKDYKSYMIEEGEVITPESALTKEGYTFSGWSEIPATMPAYDVTVTGSFSVNSYTLTYMVDGAKYKTASVEYGVAITAETAPTKDGYTFSGWSEIPATMPAHDVMVTGIFTINSYTLTYMVDGKEYQTVEVEYGAEIYPIGGPEKEGYTFVGWENLPEETMPAHNVVVTGCFTINRYKMTYIVDGTEYKTIEVDYGTDINPVDEPTKTGYTFSGWSEIPTTMPAHDITVNGSFSVNLYRLSYVVNDKVYETDSIAYGTEAIPIEGPEMEGYTFIGWTGFPTTMPAYDVIVVGFYTVNSYKVTFMYGDNVLTTIEVNYGETIELPTSLNSERYILVNWMDVPETMPAHDIIIYADYVDGINDVIVDNRDIQYIQMNGIYTNEMKKGVNIIRMKDGTTRKVFMK